LSCSGRPRGQNVAGSDDRLGNCFATSAKQGAGTLTLTGTNTYFGGNFIEDGRPIAINSEAIEDGTYLYIDGDLSQVGGVISAQVAQAAAAPAVSPVPEPGTLVLLAAAGTLLFLHRRRR
jgi:autotransporter-associated beta strand protein